MMLLRLRYGSDEVEAQEKGMFVYRVRSANAMP